MVGTGPLLSSGSSNSSSPWPIGWSVWRLHRTPKRSSHAMLIAAKALKRSESAFPNLPKDTLQRLLMAVERPFVHQQVRARLQKLLERWGEQHVLLLLRTIVESEGNQNALVEPIVSAVSSVIVHQM